MLTWFFTPQTPASLVLSSLYMLPGIIVVIPFILFRKVSWIIISRLVVSTILGPIIPVIPWLVPLLSCKLNQLSILNELLD
jgi:hypothetical protein